MAKTAFVFSGRNGLDQIELRVNVLRIPEVAARIREAQKILDSTGSAHIDLHTTIASSDDIFMRNIRLKNLCATIVQVALFDRAIKLQNHPDLLVGGRVDSPLAVVSGTQTFQSLVEETAKSVLFRSDRLSVVASAQEAPILTGLSLTEFEAVAKQPHQKGAVILTGFMDLKKLLAALAEEHDVQTIINIGPGGIISARDLSDVRGGDIEVLDSIELDPLLAWFWKAVEPKALAN